MSVSKLDNLETSKDGETKRGVYLRPTSEKSEVQGMCFLLSGDI